ncbi:hypothetical protein [Hoeflea sp.]|uniref:hypothetical protein n=1 Tax=Hoeflea sp. TaxID=1940281 RepID=UPI003A912EBB
MRKQLKKFLFIRATRLGLRKKSPSRIPLSGPRVFARDYYSVSLSDKDDPWRFLVQSETATGFAGLWFDRVGEPGEEREVPYDDLPKFGILITQYFGELEIRFTSALEFLVNYRLGFHWLRLWRGRLQRYVHNRKPLERMRRLEVLQIFHDRNLEDWDYTASPEQIMYEIYGHSWKAHPDNTRLYRYYELTLKSLAASGDLTVNQSTYQIAPKALETLFHADENKRRHDDLQGQQTAMRWLTTALVVVGILQAVVAGIGPVQEFLQPSPASVEASQPASSHVRFPNR